MMTDAEKREAVCSAMAIAYNIGRIVAEGTATEGEGYSDYVRACGYRSAFSRQKKEFEMEKTIDAAMVRELTIFADNDARMYAGQKVYRANAIRRMVKGTYDPALAVQLWIHYVEAIIKAYGAEYGVIRTNKPTREAVAAYYARDFEDLVDRGYVTPADCGVNKGEVVKTW